MYSINRDTETSLRESLLPDKPQNNDDTISLLQSSLKKVNSAQLLASSKTLRSPSQKVIKNVGEEMTQYLESFLSPYDYFFKFNKEETKLFFIKENEEQKMILCMYDLTKNKPQYVKYRVPESSQKFDKIDLTEDGEYILFSSNAEIVIQRTDSLNDYDNELSPLNHVTLNLDNEDQDDVFPFFSTANQVVYFQLRDGAIKAQQTQFSVNVLFGDNGMKIAQNNAFTISAQIETEEEYIRGVYNFNSCFYIKGDDEVHVYLPEITTNDIKQKANFWDPLKGNQIDDQCFFENVQELILSNDILIIFFNDLVVKFFIKSPPHENSISKNSCIKLIKEFDINKFDDGSLEIYPFKLYQDNLYLDNSTLRNIQVVSLKKENIVWSYSYQYNYDVSPKVQLQKSPQINFFDMDSSAVTCVDEFDNEILFTNMFPHQKLENKFIIAENEHDLLFRNVNNEGLISILDRNQKEHIRKVGDSFNNVNGKIKNQVRSIYYSEKLKLFFLLQSICKNYDPKDINEYQYSLFTLSIETFNYEIKQIPIEKLSNEKDGIDLSQIIGAIHCSETNKNSLILYVKIDGKGLLMYRFNFKEAQQEISVIKNFDGSDHQVLIQTSDSFQALIIKDQKMILSKQQCNYSLFFNFNDTSQTIQFDQTSKKLPIHNLLRVVNNIVYMIEGETRNIILYEIEPNKKQFIKLRSMNPIISPQTFIYLWEQNHEYFIEGYVISSNNFLIRQRDTTIYIYDIENFEVRCKINNVPLLCKFMRTSDDNLYLFANSSIDPSFQEVKRFNFLKDQKLLKLYEKQQLQEKLFQGYNQLSNEQTQLLEKNIEVFQSNIPIEFQLSKDTCVVYDYLDSSVELLDSRDTINKKISCRLQNRSIAQKSLLKSSNQALFIDFLMKEESNFNECLYFDTMNNQSILSLVLDKPLVMKYIIERFLMMNEQDLPFLMFKDQNGKTPLDYAIEGQQFQNIEQLIKLIVYHKSAAQMYNSLIDKNLIKLIEMELNLKDLLESEILYQPIHCFDPLDSSKNSYLYPTLFDIEEEIIKNKELIVNDSNKLLITEDQDKENDKSLENKQIDKKFSVNFTLISLKKTITCQQSEEQNSLMQTLMDQTRDDIFEFSCIQNIIDYKWNTYAKKEYLSQFRWFFALVIMFYLSLGIQLTIIDEQTSGQENFIVAGLDLMVLSNAILTIFCSLITLKFLIFEVKQLLSYANKLEYFQELWNINDLVFLVLIPVYCFLSIIQFQDLSGTIMKSVKILIVAALFVKMIFYLRIFETFSFLVSMLENVLIQLKAFFIFFMMVVIAFSCFIQVLLPESSTSYEGTGYFSYIMLSLRTAIGDFTFDSYKAQDMKGITWVVWLFLMIMGNIVFMNFIIAVIGDSYQSSMSKKVSQTYRLKVPFIVEIEKQLSSKESIDQVKEQWKNSIQNQKLAKEGSAQASEQANSQLTICFPSYIVVQTLSTGEAAAKDSLLIQIDIQNSINSLKKTQALIQKQIENNQSSIDQKIEKGQENMAKQIEEVQEYLENKIRQNQEEVQSQLESLNQEVRQNSERTMQFLQGIDDALKEGFGRPRK